MKTNAQFNAQIGREQSDEMRAVNLFLWRGPYTSEPLSLIKIRMRTEETVVVGETVIIMGLASA